MVIFSCASLLLGAVVAFICVTIYSLVLGYCETLGPEVAIRQLKWLAVFILGGGGIGGAVDYVVFDFFLEQGGLVYYVIGFAGVFLPLAWSSYQSWRRRGE